MILSILRSVGSVVAGLVAAFIPIIAAEVFSSIYHPFPPGVDPSDYEVCKAHVARYPTWVLAACTAIWAAALLAGSWLATRLGTARHPAHGLVVGAILLALAGLNMAMLPYPIWFPVVILLTFPLGTILGVRLANSPRVPQG
jgi:MFS family permease